MSSAPSNGLRIVVVGNPTVDSCVRRNDDGEQARPDVEVVMVENVQQVEEEAHRGRIDALVVTDHASLKGLSDLSGVIDLSRTLIFAGPVSVADACDGMHWFLARQHGEQAGGGAPTVQEMTLEDYVESKFGEFVRSMEASSARSLHATLIWAVEGPLIQHALRETDGNQVRAARLLGMNRNTLRKKIEQYHIPVQRRSRAR